MKAARFRLSFYFIYVALNALYPVHIIATYYSTSSYFKCVSCMHALHLVTLLIIVARLYGTSARYYTSSLD